MNKFLYTTFLSLFCVRILSQVPVEAGIFVGGAVYNGDIDVNIENFIPQIRPAAGILGRVYLIPQLSVRGQLNYVSLYGDEKKHPASIYRKQRGFSFKTNITEISLAGEWHMIGLNRKFKFDKEHSFIAFYGFGGGSSVFFNPKTVFNEPNPFFESVEADKNGNYNKRAFALLGGGGVRMMLNDHFSIAGELSARRAHTDYLDGISKVINSRSKDYYVVSGITLTYLFSNEDGSSLFTKGKRNIRRYSACPNF